MADLASLFQVAPWAGSYIAGDMLGQEANYNDTRRQELMQLIQQRMAQAKMEQEKHPFELERLGLQNQTTKAQLPGIEATSRSLGLKADEEAATYGSRVEQANSKNYNEVFKMVAPQFGVIGQEISGVPPIQQPMALHQALRRRGLNDEQAQRFVQYFAERGTGDIPKQLGTIGDAYLRANPEYVRDLDRQIKDNEGNMAVAKERSRSAVEVANIHEGGANSRHKATQEGKDKVSADTVSKADKEASGKPPMTQLGVYKKWYDHAVATGDAVAANALYAKAASLAETVKNLPQSQPRAGTEDIDALTKGKVPTNPVPTVPIQANPFAPQPAATASPSPDAGALLPAGAAQIEQRLKAAGQAYEPNKFDYRIGPNGQVQKKPKGK